jgi:protein regulator of cytokinesis 1
LDVYKRKVDQALKSRDLLLQALDYSKMELARLASALGEKSIATSVSEDVSVSIILV